MLFPNVPVDIHYVWAVNDVVGKTTWKDHDGSLQLLWEYFNWKDPSEAVN